MKPNFWIYSNREEQEKTANSLIIFGAEVFKRAKAITEINILKRIKKDFDNKINHPKDTNNSEFIFEYLIDCIRFLIFFENYMKAELIVRDYCVHFIDKNHPGFKNLAKKQYSMPIKLKEINEIENFFIDPINKIINHPAIKDKTIGIKELISSEQYYSNYQFDSSMLDIISKFNTYRNRLHFNDSIEYQISENFVSSLAKMNEFVDKIIRDRIE
jgi:hypothetical protein